MRPAPGAGLLGGGRQQPERVAAADQLVLADGHPVVVAGQDEVVADPAVGGRDGIALEDVANEARCDRDRLHLAPDGPIEQVVVRPEGVDDRPPLTGLGPGQHGQGRSGRGGLALGVGDAHEPAVGRDAVRAALEVQPVGLGQDHLRRVLVRDRVRLAGTDPDHAVARHHVVRPALCEHEEAVRLARVGGEPDPVVADLTIVGVVPRDQVEAERPRGRPGEGVADDRPGPAVVLDAPRADRAGLDPPARRRDQPERIRRPSPVRRRRRPLDVEVLEQQAGARVLRLRLRVEVVRRADDRRAVADLLVPGDRPREPDRQSFQARPTGVDLDRRRPGGRRTVGLEG